MNRSGADRLQPESLAGFERDLRRARFDQLVSQFTASNDADLAAERYDRRLELGQDLAGMLQDLEQHRDAEAFRAGADAWSKGKDKASYFNGPSGQMFLNQLVNYNDGSHDLAALLVDVTAPPDDWDDAEAKFARLLDYCAAVKRGSHPQAGRSQFFLSYFWNNAAPDVWPVSWASAESAQIKLGWRVPSLGPIESYRASYDSWQDSGLDTKTWEMTLNWFDSSQDLLLDPTLVERCAWAKELDSHWTDNGYVSSAIEQAAEANAQVLVRGLRTVMDTLQDGIAEVFGRPVSVASPKQTVSTGRYRTDGWADARVIAEDTERWPGARIWVGASGVAVGLRPGFIAADLHQQAVTELEPILPGDIEIINHRSDDGSAPIDRGLFGNFGEPIFARWFDGQTLLEANDQRDQILSTFAALQPACDRLVKIGPRPGPEVGPNDPLAELVKEFLSSLPYPNQKTRQHQADRERFAEWLAPERIETIDLADFRSIYNTGRYGSPGPQTHLNVTVREAETDAQKLEELLGAIRYLCWGEDKVEVRLDRLLDRDDMKVHGLDEAVLMKLLAITHPDRFVPRYPYQGVNGKLHSIRQLKLEEPSESLSRGERQIAANDTLRDRLERFFPSDTWGLMEFLYWLDNREEEDETDVLLELSKELYVEQAFLEEVVELLQEKKQVIFYGPPGTGKTYLAQKLADALTRAPADRMLVQFHPSTSYEDFFEGYRPETDANGQLSYRLTEGPLALMAAQATDSKRDHVMVIDEINRANLSKVFGELLFLLEYREESVRSLYRPNDAFELPKNLLFIGTMNG